MTSPSPQADESRLSWVERWAPSDAERWGRWRRALTAEQRAEALIPLQAALSGLVAFRHLDNHPLCPTVTDFRPHLHAVVSTYDWARSLVSDLGSEPAPRAHSDIVALVEPQASLRALERSLTDASRVTARLLELPLVDAGAFQASSDLFLRDLASNAFFRPPEPLEFANVRELVLAESITPSLEAWKSEAAKLTASVAFLALVRSHRFLGIADQLIHEEEGLYKAHVVVASVRRELRTLTRFLLVQGVESLAEEFEARLLLQDDVRITRARTDITENAQQLHDLRDAMEALATTIHTNTRNALDQAIPALETEGGVALEGERLRQGIADVRLSVKKAARDLRSLAQRGAPDDAANPPERNLQQDIWAFRFILRAFVAKAAAQSVGAQAWDDVRDATFVREFVRHYRLFGPRVLRNLEYPRRGLLARAVSDLGAAEAVTSPRLSRAARESALLVEHLDGVFDSLDLASPLDRETAAEQLRGYLDAAKERSASDRAAAGAFGVVDPCRARTA